MKTLLYFSIISFLFTIGVSCSSSDDDPPIPASTPTPTLIPSPTPSPVISPTPDPIPEPAPTDVIITFKANLLPATDITYVTPYGDATLQFNQTAKTFKIVVVTDNFNPNYGNIHTADGTIVFIFPANFFKYGINTFSSVINDNQITELMANHYYVNINGDGDINGQLIKQ